CLASGWGTTRAASTHGATVASPPGAATAYLPRCRYSNHHHLHHHTLHRHRSCPVDRSQPCNPRTSSSSAYSRAPMSRRKQKWAWLSSRPAWLSASPPHLQMSHHQGRLCSPMDTPPVSKYSPSQAAPMTHPSSTHP